jgi:hypothetical protein
MVCGNYASEARGAQVQRARQAELASLRPIKCHHGGFNVFALNRTPVPCAEGRLTVG